MAKYSPLVFCVIEKTIALRGGQQSLSSRQITLSNITCELCNAKEPSATPLTMAGAQVFGLRFGLLSGYLQGYKQSVS